MGLTYGWVPLACVLAMLLAGVGCLLTGRATAPTIALLAQVPAFATVALITQYSTFTWFVAGLAVFSQATLRRAHAQPPPGEPAGERDAHASPELVSDIRISPLPILI